MTKRQREDKENLYDLTDLFNAIREYPRTDDLDIKAQAAEELDSLIAKAKAANQLDTLHDLNALDKRIFVHEGVTALYFACSENNGDAVDSLIKAGASIDIHNSNGSTPLHNAAWGNHLIPLVLLLRAGANLNLKDKDGFTPLDVAISENETEAAILMILAGANPKKVSQEAIDKLLSNSLDEFPHGKTLLENFDDTICQYASDDLFHQDGLTADFSNFLHAMALIINPNFMPQEGVIDYLKNLTNYDDAVGFLTSHGLEFLRDSEYDSDDDDSMSVDITGKDTDHASLSSE